MNRLYHEPCLAAFLVNVTVFRITAVPLLTYQIWNQIPSSVLLSSVDTKCYILENYEWCMYDLYSNLNIFYYYYI